MKGVILITIMSLGVCFAFAQTKSTPEASVKLSVSGIQVEAKSNSLIVEEIVAKLSELDKYRLKLSRAEQSQFNEIMADIHDLLRQIALDASVSINTGLTTASSAGSGTQIQITPGGAPSTSIQLNPGIHSASDAGKDKEPEKSVAPKTPVKDKPAEQPKLEKASQSNRKAITEADFNDLIKAINSKSFSDDKFLVLESSVKHFKFKVDHIIRIIGCFTHSDDKVEALRISYPEVIDPQNNYKIYDAFTYSSSKEKAKEIMDN